MSGPLPLLPDPADTLEVSPAEVAGWLALDGSGRPRLVDCREAEELSICQIPGSEWVPLGTFPEKSAALTADAARGVVVFCHHGMRSLRAVAFLRSHGVANAYSMAGGIDAWSRMIDPAVPRY